MKRVTGPIDGRQGVRAPNPHAPMNLDLELTPWGAAEGSEASETLEALELRVAEE